MKPGDRVCARGGECVCTHHCDCLLCVLEEVVSLPSFELGDPSQPSGPTCVTLPRSVYKLSASCPAASSSSCLQGAGWGWGETRQRKVGASEPHRAAWCWRAVPGTR